MEKTIFDERTGWEYELIGEQYYPTGRVMRNGALTPSELPDDHGPGEGQTAVVCAVGDDDQAIYRFRGATVSNILSFEERYPSVKRVTLSTNFRSTHAIVEIANAAVTGQRIGRKQIPGLHRRLPKTMQAQHYNTATNQFEETMAEHGDVWNCVFANEQLEAAFSALSPYEWACASVKKR